MSHLVFHRVRLPSPPRFRATVPQAPPPPGSNIDFHLESVTRGISELREEIAKLKAEKLELQTQIQKLLPVEAEVKVLREHNEELKRAVGYLVIQCGCLPEPPMIRESATFMSLPQELVLRVFQLSISPHHQHDPSVTHGSLNPWLIELRTKKALPMICKATYWPGTEILYSDIVLRRMGQIPALARTLRMPTGKDIAVRIKSIRIDSCPLWLPYADVMREDLAYILESTPLHSFSYHPHSAFPSWPSSPPQGFFSISVLQGQSTIRPLPQREELFNPTEWLVNTSPGSGASLLSYFVHSGHLHTLDLAMDLDGALAIHLHDALQPIRTLKTLKLGRVEKFEPSETLASKQALRLPNLQDLQFFSGTQTGFDEYICSWELPALTHLTLLVVTAELSVDIMERFGSRLVFLHLYPAGPQYREFWDLYPWGLSEDENLLPCIQHLIAPFPDVDEYSSCKLELYSPTLTYLDLWKYIRNDLESPYSDSEFYTRGPPEDFRKHIGIHSSVPNLRTVRAIFCDPVMGSRLRSPVCNVDWPSVCHPDLIQDPSTVLYHRFPGTVVVQTALAILPQQLFDRCRPLDSELWPEAYYRCGFMVHDPATREVLFDPTSECGEEEQDMPRIDIADDVSDKEDDDGEEHEADDGKKHEADDGRKHEADDGRKHEAGDGKEHEADEDRFDEESDIDYETDSDAYDALTNDDPELAGTSFDRDTVLDAFAQSTEARLWDF